MKSSKGCMRLIQVDSAADSAIRDKIVCVVMGVVELNDA